MLKKEDFEDGLEKPRGERYCSGFLTTFGPHCLLFSSWIPTVIWFQGIAFDCPFSLVCFFFSPGFFLFFFLRNRILFLELLSFLLIAVDIIHYTITLGLQTCIQSTPIKNELLVIRRLFILRDESRRFSIPILIVRKVSDGEQRTSEGNVIKKMEKKEISRTKEIRNLQRKNMSTF